MKNLTNEDVRRLFNEHSETTYQPPSWMIDVMRKMLYVHEFNISISMNKDDTNISKTQEVNEKKS